MLNPFPQLLSYAFFAPTLIRVAAALVFAYVAWMQWDKRVKISHIKFPLIGGGMWIVWVTLIVEAAATLGLLFGYYTQWAAILGALLSIKYFVWHNRYEETFPISRVASVLLLVICLSLLLSGAGALARDLPL